ncbi:MAG: hypothetical protein AAGF30_14480 [Pseudomonadota bacterium]
MKGWVRDGRGWFESREGETYAIARRVPVRWDLRVETRLPEMGRRRLAHAVRQDMWRMLRNVRGFQPAVEVTRVADGLRLVAGGAVAGAVPPDAAGRIAWMLDDRGHRAAWARSAGHRK